MNTVLFFSHLILVIFFLLSALRLGKVALSVFIALCAVCANLFVIKQIDLFHLVVTPSDVFAVGLIMGMNLLQEFYGKTEAQKALWGSFFAMAFFVVISQVHLLYVPSVYDNTQSAFATILRANPRIMAASFLTFFLVQKIDLHFFGFLQKKFHKISLPIRIGSSLVFSQFLDTALFSVLGLYGVVHSLFHVFMMSYGIKVVIIALTTPFTTFSRKIFKQEEV